MPPTKPQPQNETAQEGNGDSTFLTAVLYDEMLTMTSTVVSDPVIVAPVRNPPAVVTFPLEIDVPPPLPLQLLPPSPPHLQPPLP